MNATANPLLERAWNPAFSPSAQLLRQWSAPGVILAVTNLADEQILLFHAIQQARRSTAKVLLVHVLQSGNLPFHARAWIQPSGFDYSAESALASLNRMARKLRWVGIPCEPLLLRGLPATEIPLAAKASGAHRILLTAACQNPAHAAPGAKSTASKLLAEELLPAVAVPICTVAQGRPVPPLTAERPGMVTLALSLQSDATVPLAFAARLAQEQQSRFTVLHVVGGEPKDWKGSEPARLMVASRLPADRLREAELMCRLDIAVRQGDPAGEILRSESSTSEDFIVLGPVGAQEPAPAGRSSVLHRVISEARCPVIVLTEAAGRSASG